MSNCPYCGAQIIEGVDVCDECGHSVVDLHLPTPATSVERNLISDRVHVLDAKHPLVVASNTPIGEVLKILVDNSVGCALVVDGGQLVGVFSERDALVKLNVDATALRDEPVSRFMTENPESLDADSKIAFAVHRMDLGGYRHLPIVDRSGKLISVISVRDILRYLSQKMSAAETA